jgi:hypothetical protein
MSKKASLINEVEREYQQRDPERNDTMCITPCPFDGGYFIGSLRCSICSHFAGDGVKGKSIICYCNKKSDFIGVDYPAMHRAAEERIRREKSGKSDNYLLDAQ